MLLDTSCVPADACSMLRGDFLSGGQPIVRHRGNGHQAARANATQIPIYSGNTILGDGSVVMILDPNGLPSVRGHQRFDGRGDSRDDRSRLRTANPAHHFPLRRTGSESGADGEAVPMALVAREAG
jgi:hypothetical protein